MHDGYKETSKSRNFTIYIVLLKWISLARAILNTSLYQNFLTTRASKWLLLQITCEGRIIPHKTSLSTTI